MKAKHYDEGRIYSRFVQIGVAPEPDSGKPWEVQVLDGTTGTSLFVEATRKIWRRVLGDVDPELKRAARDSLRFLSKVEFLCWFDKNKVLSAVDIIPMFYYTRGAMPVDTLEARDKGFEAVYDDTIDGFVVKSVYAGLTKKALVRILDGIRKLGTIKSGAIVENHRIEKVDGDTLRIVPKNPPKVKG